MYFVKVIMSTFNGARYIREQIESILSQEGVSVSIIIRDDGSSDKTVEIIEEYLMRGVADIDFVSGINVGVVASFWHLLSCESLTVCEYIAFCDQDDVWEPKKLISAINALEARESGRPSLYYSSKKIVDQNLNLIGFEKALTSKGLHNILVENYATGCTVVINQSLRKILIANSKDNCIMHDWWMLLVAYACGDVVVDEKSYILYRQHGGNVIGAASGFSYWYKRFLRVFDARRGFIFAQAKSFQFSFCEQLSAEDKLLLNRFVCSEHSVLMRVYLIFSCAGFKCSSPSKVLFSIKYLLGLGG